MQQKLILLYSGGMDGFIAYRYIKKNYPGKLETLFVSLGQRYYEKEKRAVKTTLPDTRIITAPFVGKYEEEDATIPCRNLFLSMCAVWEGASGVWLIVQEDEMSIPDRSDDFFQDVTKLLSFLVGRDIWVDTPFRKMDKVDMVKWYLEDGGSESELLRTVGCFSAVRGGHCGNCAACLRRFVALQYNGINPGYSLVEGVMDVYYEKRNSYSEKRRERMQKVFGWEVIHGD